MKLGVDIFSLRFNDWNAFELLEYASKIGLDVVHFSEMEPFESLETGYLRHVKQRADELHIDIEVGMGSICPTSTTFSPERGTVKEQLSRCCTLPRSWVRRLCAATSARTQTDAPKCRWKVTAWPWSPTCARSAVWRWISTSRSPSRITPAICKAGNWQGLIEEAGPDFVGACIDTGNPLWVAESPFVTLKHLAPYVLMSHVRDSAVWPHPPARSCSG